MISTFPTTKPPGSFTMTPASCPHCPPSAICWSTMPRSFFSPTWAAPHGQWKRSSPCSPPGTTWKLLGIPVPLTQDVLGPDTKEKCAALQPGQVVLVENLRFRLEEEQNDPDFSGNWPRWLICLSSTRSGPPTGPTPPQKGCPTICPRWPACWWRRSSSSWALP